MATKFTASQDLDVFKEEKDGRLREVGNQAVWSLSSCKPGNTASPLYNSALVGKISAQLTIYCALGNQCTECSAVSSKSDSQVTTLLLQSIEWGAQWLSGRVLDSRPRGRGFEPHRRHCVVVLEQDTFILA